MIERFLIEHCSATLASIKAANLCNMTFSSKEELDRLKSRVAECKEGFPHEIGVFLNYPLGDVIGFIENKGHNYKCKGCWKVYCNECETQKTFQRYQKCRNVYLRLWKQGRSVLQLTVAV